MNYTRGNMCAKNLCKRTLLVQLIIKNVVTCFLEHSVVVLLLIYDVNLYFIVVTCQYTMP